MSLKFILSRGEERILVSLSENGGEMLQSDLSRQACLSRSRTSEILASLEKKSLVSRHPLGKNNRVVLETEGHTSRRRNLLRLGFTRSAEYPFIVPFRKLIRDDMKMEVQLKIYENGLDVARDLTLSRLDLGIAPILASFMFCSLGAPFKIVASAGSGGSSLVSNKVSSSSEPTVATTKLSTMELLLKSSMRENFLPSESKSLYVSSSQDIVDGIVSGRFDAACIWEPYATLLTTTLLTRRRRLSRVVSYKEIGDHICCALSANNRLGDSEISKIAKNFAGSIREHIKSPDRYLEQYSLIAGFDYGILRRVSSEYDYSRDIEPNSIARQFEHAGILTPNPRTIKEMIRPAE